MGYHYVAVDANGIADYLSTTDINANGIPDAWELENFGNLDQPGDGDYDGDGVINRVEYQGGSNPNDIRFETRFENLYVNQTNVTAAIEVLGGVPVQMAVLVNSTNLTTNCWQSFNTNFSVVLTPTDGVYTVSVVLRGCPGNSGQTWDETEVTLDRMAPVLTITNPVSGGTTAKPWLQVKGSANEPLNLLSYDLSNAAGVVTNQDGNVIDQVFDENRFDFTTNYFQCYDVPLTNGANTITLRAVDRAGNVMVTNVSVSLNVSNATTPPTLNLIWPASGGEVSGGTIYLRGTTDDETAQVSVRVGDAAETMGLVERDGMFWVENVNLEQGTNVLVLSATNVAGVGRSMTNILVRHDVLTIDWTPTGDALYEYAGSVSGTVSDGYSVTVNGVAATLDGWGGWTAENVPVIGIGTATFDAVAMPSGGFSGGGGGSASPAPNATSSQVEKQAQIVTLKYNFKKTWDDVLDGVSYYNYADTMDYASALSIGTNGDWKLSFLGCASHERFIQQALPVHSKWEWHWSQTNEWGLRRWGDDLQYSEPLIDPSVCDTRIPHTNAAHYATDPSQIHVLEHCYAKRSYKWGADKKSRAKISARIRQKLFTGGKSAVNRKSLIHISASAEEYGVPPGRPWDDIPATYVTPTRISVFGNWLYGRKYLDNNGDLYLVMLDNTEKDLNLNIPGVKHYGAWPEVQKHKLRIQWATVNLTNDITTAWVGQTMDLEAVFDPPFSDGIVASNYSWTVPGPAYADIDYDDNRGRAPVLTNKTNSTVLYYWTAANPCAEVKCTAEINGIKTEVIACFDVRKPEVSLSLVPIHPGRASFFL
jgi:hypothetical protein